MAKLRMDAAAARAKASDVNALKDRVYDDIRHAAEHNEFATWFYFWNTKRDMVVEVVKALRADGYEVELFEEETDDIVDTGVNRPKGDDVIAVLLGTTDNNEENSESDPFTWREIRISWN